jgi:hypothetical protein
MKNIFEIMKDYGFEVPEDKKKDFEKTVLENYKTVSDYEKQTEKVTSLTDQLNTAKEDIKKFEGVDPEALNNQIAVLNQKLAEKDTEYQNQITDRDFQDMLKAAIAKAKGRNAKAITALLDVETLKASKNQAADVEDALNKLAEAEDSKMLFGEPDAQIIGGGNPIGSVTRLNGSEDAWMAQMMAAAGVSDESNNK